MAAERRLYREIADQVLASIDAGEFAAGERLPPERELAERYGVSRPTIREAVIALEALDRVEVRAGSGIYVRDSSKSWNGIDQSISAFELTQARAMIEGEAAALAALMITDAQLEGLADALEAMAVTDTDDYEDADKTFHRIISEATGNKMIGRVIDGLWHVRDHSPAVHRAYQAICDTDGRKRVAEHTEIFEALQARDDKAARRAMHEHFKRISAKLVAAEEREQLEAIRRKLSENSDRFSINHLVNAD